MPELDETNGIKDESDALDLGSSLEASNSSTQTPNPGISLTTPPKHSGIKQLISSKHRKALFRVNGAVLILVIIIGAVSFMVSNKPTQTNSPKQKPPSSYSVTTLPTNKLSAAAQQLLIGQANELSINGQVSVGNTLVLTPTATPKNPITGQIFYNQATNTPYYYNGSAFVSLVTPSIQAVNSLGGATGAVGVGNGLQVVNNQVNLKLQAGYGVGINGTTISNTGVVSLTSGTSNISISSNDAGHYVISDNTANNGAGTINGAGTTGQIPVFVSGKSLGSSILSQSGTSLIAAGSLLIQGTIVSDEGSSFSGSLLNLEVNNGSELSVDQAGNISANGTYDSNIFTSSLLQFGDTNAVSIIQSASGQGLNITGSATSTWGTSAGNLTIQVAGTGTLALDTQGSGTITLGGNHASSVQVGNSGSSTEVNGANISVGNSETNGTIQIGNTSGAYTQTTQIGTNNTNGSVNNVTIGSTAGGTITLNGSGVNQTISGSSVTIQATANSTNTFQIQSAAGDDNDTLLGLSSTVPNNSMITNGSFEQDTNGWTAEGTNMALSQVTDSQVSGLSAPYGSAAMQIANNGSVPAILSGAEYPVSLSSNTTYALSFYTKLSNSSSSFSSLAMGWSNNGSANSACSNNGVVTMSTPTTANWTRVSCSFTTGTTSGPTYVFIGQNDTNTGRIWYVDGVSLVQTTSASYYEEGQLNLSGLALSDILVQPTAASSTAFVVASPIGAVGLQVNTVSSVLSSSFATTINSTETISTANAAALQVRNGTTLAPLILANTTISNIDTNGSFESSSSSATGYSVDHSGVTLSVDTTANNAYIGSNTGKVVTTTSTVANSGVKYSMVNLNTGALLFANNTTYTLSFFVKIPSGSFTTLDAGQSDDGVSESTCTLNSTTVNTYWQRYSCVFTTGTISGSPYFFIGQSDSGIAHTYYLDGIQIESGTSPDNYREGKIQLNGDITSPTVFRPQSDSSMAFQIQNSGGSTLFNVNTATEQITISGGNNSYNAANATLYVGSDSTTGRSINASGTINASGADYAEWIPWSGAQPPQGSIVSYSGSNYVVSSPKTAAFVGNDNFNTSNSILVTFTGQVPVLVRGSVSTGDILVPDGDGSAQAINPSEATLSELLSKVAIAQENNSAPGVKLVNASVGTTSDMLTDNNNLQSFSSATSALTLTGSADLDNLNVSGAATITDLTAQNVMISSDLSVQGLTTVRDIQINGHIYTGPSNNMLTTTEAGDGSTGTCMAVGNDTSGTISITPNGDGISANNAVCQLSFTSAFKGTPLPVITPTTKEAAAIQAYVSNTNAKGFTITFNISPSASTAYSFIWFTP
jgi:hypothetical protein